MSAHVNFEVCTLCSSVPTARLITRVRPLPSVSAHVSLEMASHSCSVPTAKHITGERPLPCVRAHVRLETAAPHCSVPTPTLITRKHGHDRTINTRNSALLVAQDSVKGQEQLNELIYTSQLKSLQLFLSSSLLPTRTCTWRE